jgi:hypothetical protein
MENVKRILMHDNQEIVISCNCSDDKWDYEKKKWLTKFNILRILIVYFSDVQLWIW